MERIGIVLAGGQGYRMHPTTKAVNKHLLPVYDKPMVMLAIDFLLSAGATKVVVVTNSYDMLDFSDLLMSEYNDKTIYIIEQGNKKGVAAALQAAEGVAYGQQVVVVLGDNLFYGQKFLDIAKRMFSNKRPVASCVAVANKNAAHDSCVVTLSDKGKPLQLVEKPKKPMSDKVVVGLYSYPKNMFDVIKTLTPSNRNELEITELNRHYMDNDRLEVHQVSMDGENQWLDLGDHNKLWKGAMLRYATSK